MKEENIKGEYQRKVDKSLIPTCNIMGVNIAAINMAWLWRIYGRNTWCSLGCILPIFVLAVFNTNFQYYLWIYWNIY